MEPLTVGAAVVAGIGAGNTAVKGTTNIASGIKYALRRLRLSGKYDPDWLDLGSAGSSLTASQTEDVHKFLASVRVQPIMRFVALAKLIPTSAAHPEIIEAMKIAFRSEAERWLIHFPGEKWGEHIGAIWERLIQIYDAMVPKTDDEGLVEDAESFVDFLASPLGKPVNKTGLATAYLDRLTKLAGNLNELVSTAEKSRHLAQLITVAGHTPIINHIEVSGGAGFQDLYVGRLFKDLKTHETVDSEDLISSLIPFRAVLKGAPGAGKSTFVGHFVQAMASPRDDGEGSPSVVVRCREYVRNAWNTSITDYAAQKTAVDRSTTLSASELENMLLTGQVIMVFDGLDEITDRSQRAEMVQRIHAFTAQYPPTSVLITTRSVGYERAPLDRTLFRQLELEEFSVEQVREYATRWFTHAGRAELIDSFMSESESVADLRINPLLLSLLCNLYRSSGEIPSNRRDIYADCAELLFKRWDAHRQIQVSHAVPRFANQLMQQIAEWFFSTTSAQSGVEERQIAKVISDYMVSDIGLLPDEARESAKEFLNFCADRAWLLGSEGTNERNERLYSFTHRTFLEFFAAEAMAREAPSPEELARRIREAFDKDSTSLVPELLIQSYDFVRRRGGTQAFEDLCKATSPTTPTLLLLRLLDGAVVAKYALEAGLKILIGRWQRSQSIPRDEFLALLAINSIARGNLVETFLMAPQERVIREIFLSSWSSYQLSGGSHFEDGWKAEALQIARKFSAEMTECREENLVNWLLVEGMEAADQLDPWSYLCCEGTFGLYGGAVWWSLENCGAVPMTEHQVRAIDKVHSLVSKQPIPRWVCYICGDVKPAPALTAGSNLDAVEVKLREILAIVLFSSYEEDQQEADLVSSSQCWPGRVEYVGRYRDWKHGHGTELSPEEEQQALAAIAELPPRIQKWAKGGKYLLADTKLT
ncbi:NACHT domain-containing protein [uncultured Arthrobacter sp.]|uniref:NACHT domain-containing protein n=1 Tax=uncultured Arthrobacter sp. TaxID=114050 RepID=UPI0032172A9A